MVVEYIIQFMLDLQETRGPKSLRKDIEFVHRKTFFKQNICSVPYDNVNTKFITYSCLEYANYLVRYTRLVLGHLDDDFWDFLFFSGNQNKQSFFFHDNGPSIQKGVHF